MATPLTDDEFAAALRTFTTAFRLELQPAYAEPVEQETLTKFLAGQPQEPTQVPAIRDWFDQVARMIREGRRMERVRVHVRTATGHAPVTAA